MSKAPQRQPSQFSRWVAELRENFSVEFVGLLLFLLGGLALLSLVPGETTAANPVPWLTQMVGWTAPLLAVALLILGAVLMLRERAGYWSVEALLGAELLLLALQMGTFVWYNATAQWEPQLDGGNGGLVGVMLGSLLVAGLGRWPAAAIIMLIGLAGVALLLRYTPLVYLYLRWLHSVPGLSALIQVWENRRHPINAIPGQPVSSTPPVKANFVSAHESDEPAASAPSAKPHLPPATLAMPEGTSVEASAPVETSATAKAPRVAKSKAKAPPPEPPLPGSGQLPSMGLLTADHAVVAQSVDVHGIQQLIEATLADFNVPVRTIHVESGPTVTQFGVEPLYLERAGQRRKVRVSRIVNLADDLALALAVPAVRIEAPVPGRPYVGIEVPNPEKRTVTLRGLLESKTLAQEGGRLALPLGRNTAGAPVVLDLTRAPHLLIAGATGAGKSVCINTIVTGLLMQHGPDRLRFVMVDPKMVELPGYNGIPHLMGKVITDVEQVMGALTWLLLQMDDRYRLFQQANVRNIDSYNTLARKAKGVDPARQPLPYIVLIIDELADLMMTAAEDIERQICRLAQMARATGIHLILATQRPSIDVVTGLIKANFPSRIAFAVTSQTDSRVILDATGAERLLGRGDMLLMRPDAAKLQRVQGCFVADDEINHIVSFWKAQALPAEPTVAPWAALMDRLDDGDELVQDAIDALRGLKSVTTSLLQRKLRVGYPKAAQLMEQLVAKGVVGADQGGGQGRPVLLKKDEEESEEGGEIEEDEA
jgi:S-DNA-T family DNA segregation ATPase FtsK/SpoIIIE